MVSIKDRCDNTTTGVVVEMIDKERRTGKERRDVDDNEILVLDKNISLKYKESDDFYNNPSTVLKSHHHIILSLTFE